VQTGQQVLNEIKQEINKSLAAYNMDKVKNKYRETQAHFYKNGFRLGNDLKESKPLTERIEPQVSSIVVERLELNDRTLGNQDKNRKNSCGKQFRTIR
jgi:hypothetical protein